MPRSAAIRFDPVTEIDYSLLRRRLATPHWREWWGELDVEFGYIVDMVDGRDGSHPFILSLDGLPVGYIQYWHVGIHQTAEGAKDNLWLMELPAASIGIDLSIGEASLLSRGIGSTVLRAFVRRLRSEGYSSIIIDPDPQNVRAVRAYRKAGFVPVPHLVGRTDGAMIMHHLAHSKENLP